MSCYRVYDADLPDYSAAIDLYEGCPQTPGRWLVIAEYAAPKTIDPALAPGRHARHLGHRTAHPGCSGRACARQGPHALAWRLAVRQAGRRQGRIRASGANHRSPSPPLIEEGGLTFAVNFDDYLDVGIFLDHRVTRNLVREHAKQARRFLNLFAYTGTATCYAADGGVEETVTVDLSNTYLDWAERNMLPKRLCGTAASFCARRRARLDSRPTPDAQPLGPDLCRPPTFSNSSKMGRRTWDVQRDHVELLGRRIAPARTGRPRHL